VAHQAAGPLRQTPCALSCRAKGTTFFFLFQLSAAMPVVLVANTVLSQLFSL